MKVLEIEPLETIQNREVCFFSYLPVFAQSGKCCGRLECRTVVADGITCLVIFFEAASPVVAHPLQRPVGRQGGFGLLLVLVVTPFIHKRAGGVVLPLRIILELVPLTL